MNDKKYRCELFLYLYKSNLRQKLRHTEQRLGQE